MRMLMASRQPIRREAGPRDYPRGMVSTRINWVRDQCHLLRAISGEFQRTRPFRGLTIGTGIHLEAKTVALILTLRDGGARLVSTGNLNTTQPDAVETLRAEGVTVIGGPTKDRELHGSYLNEVLAGRPDLILDNGEPSGATATSYAA